MRIRKRITSPTALPRLLLRLIWLSILLPITLPGLTLWMPVFVTAAYYGNLIKRAGPVAGVYDEIAQQKLIYGLLSGVLVYMAYLLVTDPIFTIPAVFIPIWMSMTLRWFEDLVSPFRALKALWRLLRMPPVTLHEMQTLRSLHGRVHALRLRLGCQMTLKVSLRWTQVGNWVPMRLRVPRTAKERTRCLLRLSHRCLPPSYCPRFLCCYVSLLQSVVLPFHGQKWLRWLREQYAVKDSDQLKYMGVETLLENDWAILMMQTSRVWLPFIIRWTGVTMCL